MIRHVIISGCSGGGKSTLLAELGRLGHAIVEEPGRRIVRAQEALGGSALPWIDLEAFARRAFSLALEDRQQAAPGEGWVFHDRSLVDAAVALAHVRGTDVADELHGTPPYHRLMFLAPPWPEIYQGDAERRHGLAEAVAEYERLAAAYPALGYEAVSLPRVDVATRARFVLDRLARAEAA